jgi:hypothetical protein
VSFVVIEAEAMEDGELEVVNMDEMFDGVSGVWQNEQLSSGNYWAKYFARAGRSERVTLYEKSDQRETNL